jgi:hypothetical protein
MSEIVSLAIPARKATGADQVALVQATICVAKAAADTCSVCGISYTSGPRWIAGANAVLVAFAAAAVPTREVVTGAEQTSLRTLQSAGATRLARWSSNP